MKAKKPITEIMKKFGEIGSETAEFVRPNEKQVAILFDLAMKGDLYSIVERLEEFEQADRNLAPFANKIKKLAKNFEEERICDLIEPYIRHYTDLI